jgi:hypothetical protein
LVASRGGQESDDGIGGEEGSLGSFQKRESIEDGDGGKIDCGIMGNFHNLEFECIDD